MHPRMDFLSYIRVQCVQHSAVQCSEGRRCVRAACPPYLMEDHPTQPIILPAQYSRDERVPAARNEAVRKIGPRAWG